LAWNEGHADTFEAGSGTAAQPHSPLLSLSLECEKTHPINRLLPDINLYP
jgi:hypothetical protein